MGYRPAGGLSAYLTPNSGILRFYVDGSLGDDNAAGTSWATAWQTVEKLESALSSILFVEPNGLVIYVHARGTFAATPMRLNLSLHGTSRVIIGCDYADSTIVRSGTVQAVGGGTELCGLVRVQVNAPMAPAATDRGRLVRFQDGSGNADTFQIHRVDTANRYYWISATYAAPAWLVAGVTVEVISSGAYFPGGAEITVRAPARISLVRSQRAVMWNLAMGSTVEVTNSSYLALAIDCRNTGGTAQPLSLVGCSACATCSAGTYGLVPDEDFYEYGLASGAAPESYLGSWALDISDYGTSNSLSFAVEHTAYLEGNMLTHACVSAMSFSCYGASYVTLLFFYCLGGYGASHPPIRSSNGAHVEAMYGTIADIAAAGYSGSLIRAHDRSEVALTSVEGNNVGTAGTGLYGATAESGSVIQFRDSTSSAAIKGKHGNHRAIGGGTIVHEKDVSIGVSEGGGPDILSSSGGLVRLLGNFSKTATNVSGGKTANMVLEVLDCGRIVQDAGKTFTVATPPSGDWPTDYGPNGAIYLHESAEARVRGLSGGAAGTTGVACKIKNVGSLVHGGAGLAGVAPLDLGGNVAPIAWPATASSDAASPTPQQCIVIPNVT